MCCCLACTRSVAMLKRHRTHTHTQACTLTLSHTHIQIHFKSIFLAFFISFSRRRRLLRSLQLFPSRLHTAALWLVPCTGLALYLSLSLLLTQRALFALLRCRLRALRQKNTIITAFCVCVCSVLDSLYLCAWDLLRALQRLGVLVK